MALKIRPTHPVAVGGYWEDAGLGGYGRLVRVLDVDGAHATVTVVSNGPVVQEALDRYGLDPRRDARGTVKRIRLDLFRAVRSGWVYVTDDPTDLVRRERETAEERTRRTLPADVAPSSVEEWSEDRASVGFAGVSARETFRL